MTRIHGRLGVPPYIPPLWDPTLHVDGGSDLVQDTIRCGRVGTGHQTVVADAKFGVTNKVDFEPPTNRTGQMAERRRGRSGRSKSWNTRWNAHATSGVMTGFVPVPDSGTPLGTPEATTHHTLCVCVGTVSANRVEEQKSDSDALLVFQTPRTGLGTRNAEATSGVVPPLVPVPSTRFRAISLVCPNAERPRPWRASGCSKTWNADGTPLVSTPGVHDGCLSLVIEPTACKPALLVWFTVEHPPLDVNHSVSAGLQLAICHPENGKDNQSLAL